MASQAAFATLETRRVAATKIASFENVRVLAWDKRTLYAAFGYTLLAAEPEIEPISWREVARFRPPSWRKLSSRSSLGSRLFRDGFHALAIHPHGNLIAAFPGAIATLQAGEREFRVSHRITRGTRPLHITATPKGQIFWGEYFDNSARHEVHIYGSEDGGVTWDVAYTFPKGSIRHVHNICYDRWQNCLWVLTGDYGSECRILRASLDFSDVNAVLAGNQQARAVAAIVTASGLFFASDTPLEQNYIYFLDRQGHVSRLSPVPSSSIYGCQNRNGVFFSTMVEPSDINRTRDVHLVGAAASGDSWDTIAAWRKDRWPMKFFQYGTAFLPDGDNQTDLLAVSTIAVQKADYQTSIWRTFRI
jgi:hypothetical protein